MKKLLLILLSFVFMFSTAFYVGCVMPETPGSGNQDVTDDDTDDDGGDTPADEDVPADAVFTTANLSKYIVVYDRDDDDMYTVAKELQELLNSKYNVDIDIANDERVEPYKYEFLLGDTNRNKNKGNIMEYSVTVEGYRFIINSGGAYSAELAVSYLRNNVFTGKKVELEQGEYYKKSFITTKQAVTSGSTARIMSANVLADAFNTDTNYKSGYYRAEVFAGSLIAFTPDVIGMQETDNVWNNVLDKYLDKIYEEYGIRYSRYWAKYQNKINYSSLIYRSDKYNVANNGFTQFTWVINHNHGYHMRNVSWAEFVSKTNSSKKFIVANTHWSYRTEHEDIYGTNELRTQCRNETNTLLSTLKSTYPNQPIFLTGDFNTSLSFFTGKNTGLNLISSFSVLSEQAKSAGKLITTVPTSGHFDHIFGTGSYTVNRFDIISNANSRNVVSDHSFVYSDVAF